MPKQQCKQRGTATQAIPIPMENAQSSGIPFSVFGPFNTHIRVEKNGAIAFPFMNPRRIFSKSDAREHADDIGCYILAKQFGKKFTPLYVGQTTRRFAQEVFNPYNRERYRQAVQDYRAGNLALFLLIPKAGHKSKLKTAIGELEKYLIGMSAKANPRLQNIYLRPRQPFSLVGIDNATPGQPRTEIQMFRKMMHF